MKDRALLVRVLVALAIAFGIPKQAMAAPLVLAAASLQEAMNAAADAWAARRHARPVLSFAASSALARQIIAGAPADIFVSADETWMDEVAAKRLLHPGTRSAFVSNRLVLVSPADRPLQLTIGKGFPLARALGGGRLAMADPDAVPAGKYGKQALLNLGVWREVEPKIVRSENVRAALALAERGEVPAAIVYATDARASKKVRIVGTFPAATHAPITYPLAMLKTSTDADAEAFRRFLLSDAGKAIFARHGFIGR